MCLSWTLLWSTNELRNMKTSSNGETFSALLAICAGNSPVTGEFPAQRPVTRSFDVFFDLRLNERLSKQLWGWWFETPSRPLWRHSNDLYRQQVFWFINHLSRNALPGSSHYWRHNGKIVSTLQWRHMNVMVSQIICNFIVCSLTFYVLKTQKINSKAAHRGLFERGIHRSTMVSYQKGPVIR